MIRRHGAALRMLLMAADGMLAFLLGIFVYQAAVHPDAAVGDFLDVFWVRSVLYGVLWVVLLYLTGAYRLFKGGADKALCRQMVQFIRL